MFFKRFIGCPTVMKETSSSACLCQFVSCRSSSRRLLQWILDTRPSELPKDPETKLWYERGYCTRFDLLFPFLTTSLMLLDVAFDLKVAITHYCRGDIAWASLTIAFALVSLVSINIVSANWFLEDQRSFKMEIMSKNGLAIKRWFYVCHVFLCGGLLRCCQIFRTVRLIRGKKTQSPGDKERFRLYIAQLQDSSALGVLEAFMEEAPQVSLQLYIMLRRRSFDPASYEDLTVALSIPKSLVLFSFNLLIYARYIRLADRESHQLKWLCLGALFFFLWRLFMLASRILALALFASCSRRYVFVVVGIHFLVSYVLLWRQECEYFESQPIKQKFFRCAIAYVHVFCFFPLEGKDTRRFGYPYYVLVLIENIVMVTWWTFVTTEYSLQFKIAMVLAECLTFFTGIVSLTLFYRCFHPSAASAREELDAGPRFSTLKIMYKRAQWERREHKKEISTVTAMNNQTFDHEGKDVLSADTIL